MLHWQPGPEGITFWLEGRGGARIAPPQWALHEIRTADGVGSGAPLLSLLEEGVAESLPDHSVLVPHPRIAGLDDQQIRWIGLPPAAPYRLNIRGQGILTSPGFRFQFQLIGHDGRSPPGIKREGSLLVVGTRRYTLLDPLYSLVTGMEAFNKLPPEEMDKRFLYWADLKKLLPDDTQVDQHLRSLTVVRADALTLDLDDQGGFDPQLLARPAQQFFTEGEEPLPGEPVLPEVPQKAFRQRFRGFQHAQARYATGGNWFVVVPEPVRRALEIVRELQEAPLPQRQAFIANPQQVLRERLQDELDETILEQVFEETPTFVSDRILRLGVWQPKLCAYTMPSGQSWLPPEEQVLAIPMGDGLYQVPRGELPALQEAVEKARAEGRQTVDWKGHHIPATEEISTLLARLLGAKPDTRSPTDDDEPSSASPTNRVPVLIDNIDEEGYVARQRPVTDQKRSGGIPGILATRGLFKHQIAGLEWLQQHWANGSPGALLADDMGLGKTLQTLAFLAWVQEQMQAGLHPRRPILIVAPTGLLKNWQDEEQLHLARPGLGGLYRAYGSELRVLTGMTLRERIAHLEKQDWVMTTYETLRDKIRYFIALPWSVAVFDEAQKIKNPTSRLTEMAKSIKADFQLMLTGTPVENRLADLWSIVDGAFPGFLGALKDFHQTYEKVASDDSNVLQSLKTKLVEETVPPLMLRRLKRDHLPGLPEKHEELIRVPMPPVQARAYAEWVARGVAARGEQGAMLEILQGLRSVSLLPAPLESEGLTDEAVAGSARLTALMQILDEIHRRGEKALVFLEFLKIQEVLAPYLQRRYQLPRLPMRITGSVAGHIRKDHVDAFQRQPAGQFDVMLLSPRAGGVGLTLTAANHVVHLSRWWNPAVEDQCTDRVFRIGQNKSVRVYYPLAIHPDFDDHSFDVNLHKLLERKRQLNQDLLAPAVADVGDLEGLLGEST